MCSDRMSDVISTYAKTAKANSSGKPDSNGTHAKQTHDAASRNNILSRLDYIDNVKSKWAVTQKATMHNNRWNTQFTELLLNIGWSVERHLRTNTY